MSGVSGLPSLLIRDKRKNILVFVKQEPFDVTLKRKIDLSSDGTKAWVVVEPETEKKAGWKFDATGCIRLNGQGKPYVEAIRGATKAIKIDLENKEYTLSKLTNDEAQAFINMKIFKSHYGKLLGDLVAALKPWLLVTIIVVIVAVALSAYNAYQIGEVLKASQVVVVK